MSDENIGRLNDLLLAERAGVEVGALLRESVPKGFLRNHLTKIEADEATSCAVLERGVRAMGGDPAPGRNDFARKVMALPTLVERLDLLARGQAWVVKRLDVLLAEELPEETRGELREMRKAHVENVDWCNARVVELRAQG